MRNQDRTRDHFVPFKGEGYSAGQNKKGYKNLLISTVRKNRIVNELSEVFFAVVIKNVVLYTRVVLRSQSPNQSARLYGCS